MKWNDFDLKPLDLKLIKNLANDLPKEDFTDMCMKATALYLRAKISIKTGLTEE